MVRFSTGTCLLLACSMTLSTASVSARTLNDDDVPTVDFNTQVKPIFTTHCTSCHGGVKQAAEISFVHGTDIVAPEGWIVEPGDPEASMLIERVVSDDPDERMPPPEHGPALSDQELGILKRWIQQGAAWGKHWSFEPPVKPEIPATKNPKWARQSVDHFVLEKLQANQIEPSEEAKPERWLRRVTLDLTGLPPSLEQREAFLASLSKAKSPEETEAVFTNVVDCLLASNSFGERWASVWLDQVRYADSKGLGLDGPRNIWKYRDWVIDAFNQDMPFDQFTVKQMAGDLLPSPDIGDYVATAGHRLTQSNEEGGTDDEEFRIAAVLDRTSTTWQAWQGLTFGCVQCHSHPYDPIEHDEFYKFAAFFNNTADSDLGEDWPTISAPLDSRDYQKAADLDQKISTLTGAVWELESSVVRGETLWVSAIGLTAKTNNNTKVVVDIADGVEEFRTVDTVTKNTDITLTAKLPKEMKALTAIQFTAQPLQSSKAITDSEWGFVLSHFVARLVQSGKEAKEIKIAKVIGDEAEPFHDPKASLNSKSTTGFSAYTRLYRDRIVTFVLESPVDIPENARLEIVLKHRVSALGAFPLVTKRGRLAVSGSEVFQQLLNNKELKKKISSLSGLKKKRAAIKSTSVPVLKERPKHLARSQQVFIRGLYLTKGDTVTPDTPDVFHAIPKDATKDRLALAKWMVSPENPLTARVLVNRIWARIFGTGIVATEEDFGSSGELPSHRELLDHLALKFQSDFGWSQKKLLKELVLSSTYRQSSVTRKELLETDSANRLLARGPKSRLPSEAVRDQSLAIAGLLSDKMHGPPVRPPLPGGVWKPFAGWDKWNTPGTDSEDRYRRAIYTYTKRSIPYPMFAAFDAPSREICTPRRLQSNTPIQALMNLNDQTMIECAEAFGQRMKKFEGSTDEKLRYGFLLATCREPEANELKPAIDLLDSYSADEREAGWIAVASVLLNLDEVLTK